MRRNPYNKNNHKCLCVCFVIGKKKKELPRRRSRNVISLGCSSRLLHPHPTWHPLCSILSIPEAQRKNNIHTRRMPSQREFKKIYTENAIHAASLGCFLPSYSIASNSTSSSPSSHRQGDKKDASASSHAKKNQSRIAPKMEKKQK